MSSRHIRGPWVFNNHTVMTVAGNFTMANEACLVVKKASGAATGVTLPPAPLFQGQTVAIKDGKGDAATNNITISPDGVTATTIDGAATLVISANYGAVILQYNGSEWNAINVSVLVTPA